MGTTVGERRFSAAHATGGSPRTALNRDAAEILSIGLNQRIQAKLLQIREI